MSNNIGEKNDVDKDRWDLLPISPVRTIVRVLGYGASKYGADDWKFVTGWRERYYSATMRHLTAWIEGQALDPESKLPHLAHAACCLLFMRWFEERGQ